VHFLHGASTFEALVSEPDADAQSTQTVEGRAVTASVNETVSMPGGLIKDPRMVPTKASGGLICGRPSPSALELIE
jgi:hypothetical protein